MMKDTFDNMVTVSSDRPWPDESGDGEYAFLSDLRGASEEELRELASARDAAGVDLYDAVHDAAGVAGVPMTTVLKYCAAGQAVTDLVLGALPPVICHEDGTASWPAGPFRGMPNSEARKRIEEGRPPPGAEPLRVGYGLHAVSICVRCGIPGGNAQHCWPKGEPVCCDAEGCDERVARAQACLEPVTQA